MFLSEGQQTASATSRRRFCTELGSSAGQSRLPDHLTPPALPASVPSRSGILPLSGTCPRLFPRMIIRTVRASSFFPSDALFDNNQTVDLWLVRTVDAANISQILSNLTKKAR
jgi:hypothetical protein